MKNINFITTLLLLAGLSQSAFAAPSKKTNQLAKKSVAATTRKVTAPGPKVYSNSNNATNRAQIASALGLMKTGQYAQAANALLSLSRRSELTEERPQIKYYLGLCLMELNLNQVASFQFVDVIKSNDQKWTRQAIEKLLIVTDRLGDETLLNYAIQRIDVNSVPTRNRDMLFFRLGEIKEKAGLHQEAVQFYSKVGSQSRYYYSALYNKGLALAEANQTDAALQVFQMLLDARSNAKVTDINKVSAQMAIARTLYQKHEWDKSIEAYSKIPRDHIMWHDAMFEKSWAMLRSARFRSSLSNFQTLHSTFYEDAYIPETLLLRSIVYLYICKYDEMEKVINLFESQYGPAAKKIDAFLATKTSTESYFQEIQKINILKNDPEAKKKLGLPYNILKFIAEEGNVRRTYSYIKKLNEEKKAIEENPVVKGSSLGNYSIRIINNRMKSTKDAIGDMARAHLLNMKSELHDLSEQASFIRYEMINGKKEALKKKIAGKDLTEVQVDENKDRSFYIQNGYEYYPFQGEYWLDEVGNYHYLGKQSCE
ncbi:MAG: tetratricopeptide repeat protein [Pseudobdellovibrio sp.]